MYVFKFYAQTQMPRLWLSYATADNNNLLLNIMNKNLSNETSYINNIHTGEEAFCSYYFWRLVSSFFSDGVKNT